MSKLTPEQVTEWEAKRNAAEEVKRLRVKSIKAILLAKGVELSVSGCGCCGSPSVTLVVDGERLVDDEDSFTIT